MTGHWLRLEGVTFKCVIGVTDRERAASQEVVVDVEVETDFTRAALSDSLDDTVDYRRVAALIIESGAASSFQLVEVLASHLCSAILAAFPRVQAVQLTVEKPRALKSARSVKAIVSARRPAGGSDPLRVS